MNQTAPQPAATVARHHSRVYAAFAITILLGGINAVAVRFTVEELPPFWGASLRFIIAAFLFWIAALARRNPFPGGRMLIGVLLYGVFNFGISYALLYWGIRDVGAGLTQVILALGPLITFLLAVIHRLEPFRLRVLAGSLLAVGGIALAFVKGPPTAVPLLPLLGMVLAAASFAESIIVIKVFPPAPILITNAIAVTTGAAMLLAGSFLAGETRALPKLPLTWAAVSYLAVFGTVIVFYLALYVNQRLSASATSYMLVLFPFVTVFVAARLLGEPLTAALLLGAVLVVIGVWFGVLAGQGKAGSDAS
jgi:drug/metabolite transporter (DMT)-like permease